MTDPATISNEQRVLLKTMTAKDAALATSVLARVGIQAHACDSVDELFSEMQKGAGALLIAEEALNYPGMSSVINANQKQPKWSDLPILVLARAGDVSDVIVRAMDSAANITVIERPLRISSLISTVRSALRARKRQYELRAVMEGLRQADQRKNEFLATLAHELRNPLAPLSTALGILALKPLNAEAAHPYYEMMGRQVQHMVRLIDDLMEVSRITRGKIELKTEPLALERVLGDAVDLSRPLLDAANHRLVLSIPEGSWIVQGDAVRLTQVFSNLLNNAAKYTPAGGSIRVQLERHDKRARVRVSDNGIGIPVDKLAGIFDMFFQVSDTARAVQGGLGIGLTLVKSLVELHGGSVSAKSDGQGSGTELTVELPLLFEDAATHELVPGPGDATLTGSILVVDDNHDAADTLAVLLQAIGATTFVAYDGMQALQVASANLPSIGILDIGMPGIDGCELAQRLREDPRHAGILLVALTGWGQKADRARIAAAGFDHHLLKPLDLAALIPLLQRPRAK